MPKLSGGQIAVKISISQIVKTGNVRRNYPAEEIKELADSILKNGLLNPVTVKRYEQDENGIAQYELVAGHRRLLACELLASQGYDYTQIDACIRTGDKAVMQLVENIQRADLSAEEKENALFELIESGWSQTKISETLSKPLSWVSDILAGRRVREIASGAGIKATGMSTKALSQLRSIPQEKIPKAVETALAEGGTNKAATDVLNKYRGKPEAVQKPVVKQPEKITDFAIPLSSIIKEISAYIQNETSEERRAAAKYLQIVFENYGHE